MLGPYFLTASPRSPGTPKKCWRCGRSSLALLAVAVAFPCLMAAQSVTPGSRVRLTLRDSASVRIIGEYRRVVGDTLWVGPSTQGMSGNLLTPQGILRLDLVRAEVSLGRARERGRSALIGGAVGAAVGIGAGLIEGPQPKCEGFECLFSPFSGLSRGAMAALLGLSYGLVGAGVGALAAPQIEKWHTVPIGTLIGGERGPAIAVGLRVRFATR